MKRKVIKIDEDKCNGCGLCVSACHEGAIGLAEGKARLLKDDYCDGLGNCLPACPTGAISFEQREAPAYDAAAVASHQGKTKQAEAAPLPCGCPGTHSHSIRREAATLVPAASPVVSQLNQWPVQIKLAPVNAAYFNNANLLIAADCAAYAYGDFHNRFLKNRIVLIGCPKLDAGDYADKLTEILRQNEINSVTVIRMEVPCCGGIVNAVKTALMRSGKLVPWQVITIGVDGQIIEG